MYVPYLRFNFSVYQLAKQRLKFQHKICFREVTTHLRLKSSPTSSLTSRLFRDGNYLRLYKKCQLAFTHILLKEVKFLPQNNEFKNLFDRYYSFRDFNRILFWKIMSVNSLFNLKKLKNKKILYYLRPERRLVLVLLWLKNISRLSKSNYKNCTPQLFTPILKFIYSNKDSNEIFRLKLKIYKIRMSRG